MPTKINPWVFVGLDLSEPRRVRTFLEVICNHYNLKLEDLKVRNQSQRYANAKKAICYYLNEHFNYSEHKIANNFELGIKRECIHYHKNHYKKLMEFKYSDVVELNEKLKPLL